MARLILTGASPLIGLSRIGGVHWLRAMFGEVHLTEAVRDELLSGPALEADIRAALAGGWLRLYPRIGDEPPPPQLGEGEWRTIVAASLHDGPTLLLMDERLGRLAARARGLTVAGTAAVIGQARREGLIASAREAFEALGRSDFRIAPEVVRAVLEGIGEQVEHG